MSSDLSAELDPLDLVGTWDLSREIIEHPSGDRSSVAGSTSLALQRDGRICWSEAGTLTRQGLQTPVTRVLYIEQRDDSWFVTFDDGRDFHAWRPGSDVEHVCSPDLYIGTVQRQDVDQWSVQWRVTGPSKDYTMTSMLSRATTQSSHP